MVHLQIVGRTTSNLTTEIRTAIAEERIRSFEVTQVRGGVRLRHKRHPGEIRLQQSEGEGPLLVTVRCRPTNQEWQLLSAFIGRLTDHFTDQISSINIQLEPNEPVPVVKKKQRAKRKRAKQKK